MIASSILTIILVAGVAVMASTLQSWVKNTRKVDAENSGSYAVRYIASRLQEAYSASVSSDGKTLTYYLPIKDGNGRYVTPIVAENTARQFYVSDGNLYDSQDGETRLLVPHISLVDPLIAGSDKSYKPFLAGTGQVVHTITVHLVTLQQTSDSDTNKVRSRHRQTILLRNTPEITQ